MESTRPVGTTVALVVTVLYGMTLGVLAVLGMENLGTVAAIGAIAIGAMWVVLTLVRGKAGRTG